MNIGAPEGRLALPGKQASFWGYVKILSFLVCLVAIAAYIVTYYFVPKATFGFSVNPSLALLEIAGPALLDARNKVTVTTRIQGYLKDVNVDRNDKVKAGEVLAELEFADLASQVVAAEADAKATESAISEARSDQQRASALADKAKQDYDRKLSLRDKQIITEADWSATDATYHQTQADLARSATTIAKTSAQSVSADANANLLRVRLGYATIRSPLNGVVVSRDRNVGDLLSPGTALMQLVDPDTIIISARLDEIRHGRDRTRTGGDRKFRLDADRELQRYGFAGYPARRPGDARIHCRHNNGSTAKSLGARTASQCRDQGAQPNSDGHHSPEIHNSPRWQSGRVAIERKIR